MELDRFILQMADDAQRVRALAEGISDEQARWRPDRDSWSILEVLNHLHDEEREDFRRRLQSTLADPSEPWPAIDPGGWVGERRYQERDMAAAVEDFLEERKQSVGWLNDLASPAWENRYSHPLLGEITADASKATGIPKGLPLVAAAADKACEVLGAGCLDPSVACLSYGT